MKPLTPAQEAFAQAVADLSAPKSQSDAYRIAYDCSKMKPASIHRSASELAALPEVASRVAELRQVATDAAVMKSVDVLREWITIATADPAELVRMRRHCCRRCHGEGGHYQWIDELEFGRAYDDWSNYMAMRTSKMPPKAPPSFEGGVGFDRTQAPRPGCQGCQGDGEADVYVPATETLSPGARKLYAGIQTTRDGIRVLMRDQDAALQSIARALGMFPEKREISGPGGGPIPTASVVLTADMPADEAMKLYQAAMG